MALPKLNTPTYELKLPSSGKIFKFRPFLVKEHKVLLTMVEADEKETNRIVRELINACTFGTLDANKLPHFDVEFVFLHLRAKSIGERVEVLLNCGCGNKIDTSYSINDLKVIRPEGHSNKFMIDDQYGVEMDYPQFIDVLEVFNTDDTSRVIDLVTSCIKGVYDNENYWEVRDQPKEEVESFVNSLTKSQFDRIENFFVTSPKVVQEVIADCNKCGKHNVTTIEGLKNFFV